MLFHKIHQQLIHFPLHMNPFFKKEDKQLLGSLIFHMIRENNQLLLKNEFKSLKKDELIVNPPKRQFENIISLEHQNSYF